MGLFGNKEYKNFLSNMDNINDALPYISLSKQENLKGVPMGTFARKIIVPKEEGKNKLILTTSYKDTRSVENEIIQHILNQESIVVLDPEAYLYTQFVYMLRNRNYRIKYIDIDNEDSATWSIFDGDNMDIDDICYRVRLLLNIFKDDYMSEEEIKTKFNGWVDFFSALFARVIATSLLKTNKFEEMRDILEYNSIEEINGMFFQTNDIVEELWFNRGLSNDDKEYYTSLSLAVLDELAAEDTNRLLTNSDMDFLNLVTVPTAYFLNPIPNDVENNMPLNIILSYSIAELNDFFLYSNKKGAIPVHYIINNIDYFPGFSFFLQFASEIKTNKLSFTFSCTDLDYISKIYNKNILNVFFNNLFFVIIHKGDKKNIEILSKYMFEIDYEIPDKFLEDNCVIIAYDKTIYCNLYDISNHPLYDQYNLN